MMGKERLKKPLYAVWAASGVVGAVTIEWGWVVVGTISAIVFFVGGIIVFAIRKRQRRSPF